MQNNDQAGEFQHLSLGKPVRFVETEPFLEARVYQADDRVFKIFPHRYLFSVHRDDSGIVTAVKDVPYISSMAQVLLPEYHSIAADLEGLLGKPVTAHKVNCRKNSVVIFETEDLVRWQPGTELVGFPLKIEDTDYTVFPSYHPNREQRVSSDLVVCLQRGMTAEELAKEREKHEKILNRSRLAFPEKKDGLVSDYLLRGPFGSYLSDGTALFGPKRGGSRKK